MRKSCIYQNGKVELLQLPTDVDEALVIVTFLPKSGSFDLASRGINQEQAANLRARLQSFAFILGKS
jgi:hypothetical protein